MTESRVGDLICIIIPTNCNLNSDFLKHLLVCFVFEGFFGYFHRTQIRSVPCLVTQWGGALVEFGSNCWICQSCFIPFSSWLHGFVKIVALIFLSCYMDLSKLLHGFVYVFTRIHPSCFMYFLPNKAKLEFNQDFKASWSFCFDLKVLSESKYSMPWVRCALYCNIFLKCCCCCCCC